MNSADHIERRYSGISKQELQQHIRFCCRALAADSSVDVVFDGDSGRIPIWKRKFKTKTDCLELQISTGHLGREVVERIAAEFQSNCIEFKIKYTQKRRALSRVTTSHEIDDVFTPKEIVGIIVSVGSLCEQPSHDFSIEYFCKFEKSYLIGDDDPVRFKTAYRLGHSIGNIAGNMGRLFKK